MIADIRGPAKNDPLYAKKGEGHTVPTIRWPRREIERYGYAFAVLCIVVSTALFVPGREYFAKGQWALLYLLTIGIIAGVSGVRPAVLAAVLAFLTWNYFLLPPYHTFRIHESKDWISVFAFLVVGISVGIQTGRMRDREAEALIRERESVLLNRFSAHLVSDIPIPEMADALLAELSRITGAQCAVIFLPDKRGVLHPVRSSMATDTESYGRSAPLAEWVYRESKAVGLPEVDASSEGPHLWPASVSSESLDIGGVHGTVCLPLVSTTQQEGTLFVGPRLDGCPYQVHEARLLVAVANLVAAFLERKRLQVVAVQADALQEADRLKSTFVSSVSHELKTPLAAMTATVSNLLEEDLEWDQLGVRRELASLQNNLDRLNTSIGSLVDLSRLESAAWEPKKEWCDFGDILGTALAKLPAREKERVSFDVPDDLLPIYVDFQQWARALANLLENALTYSDVDSIVRVSAIAGEADMTFTVEDSGPGVSVKERERIFDKFYRGAAAEKAPSGTGLGLAITREIVRFCGGKIWVEDVIPHGARFVISLPKQAYSEDGRQ